MGSGGGRQDRGMGGRRVAGATAVVLGLLLLGAAPPKYGPAGAPLATPLAEDHRFLQERANPAPDFWALNAFYVPQGNELSCSAASVAAVLNALAALNRERSAETANLTEAKLLAEVRAAHWRERVTPPGHEGRAGLTLAELAEVLTAALARYGFSGYAVEATPVREATPEALARLRRVLAANERSAADLLLIHFLQDKVTATPGGPFAHISPVGAYDAAARRVLILDVDRQWYEPYWVSDGTLLQAMAAPTEALGHGGYLWIRPAALP